MKNPRNLNGYRLVYKPEYPGAMTSSNWVGYVYEHIYVMEQSLGRSLQENEVVHHLNGNRSDNRRANLILLSTSDHRRLHTWISNGAPYEGILGGNALNSGKPKSVTKPRICIVCNKTIQSGSNEKYCSNTCSGIASRRTEHPSEQQLRQDIHDLSWEAIGRKYGVSSNSVRKWARKYGLIG